MLRSSGTIGWHFNQRLVSLFSITDSLLKPSLITSRPGSSLICREYNKYSHRKRMAAEEDSGVVRKKFGNTEKLRHVKHREKLGGKLPIAGLISIQVVGTGGYGAPKAILLTTEHNK